MLYQRNATTRTVGQVRARNWSIAVYRARVIHRESEQPLDQTDRKSKERGHNAWYPANEILHLTRETGSRYPL